MKAILKSLSYYFQSQIHLCWLQLIIFFHLSVIFLNLGLMGDFFYCILNILFMFGDSRILYKYFILKGRYLVYGWHFDLGLNVWPVIQMVNF